MNEAQSTIYFAYAVMGLIAITGYLASPKAEGGPRRWTMLCARIRGMVGRYVPRKDDDAGDDDRITAHQDAVKENEESGKTQIGPTPAELDRMLVEARHEGAARAVGILVGADLLPADRRAKALIAVGIEGRRYTRLKPLVDSAQAAARTDAPPPVDPPRMVKVYEGRPDERSVSLN
jgi:hypothetical protein